MFPFKAENNSVMHATPMKDEHYNSNINCDITGNDLNLLTC